MVFLLVPWLLMGTESARATLIDHNTYTTDTVSNLDWLDVTLSVNMSYFQVSAQFRAGGMFEGWRYATVDEFSALVTTAGGINGAFQQNEGVADKLVDLLGDTFKNAGVQSVFTPQEDLRWTYGRLADKVGNDHWFGYIIDHDPYDPAQSQLRVFLDDIAIPPLSTYDSPSSVVS